MEAALPYLLQWMLQEATGVTDLQRTWPATWTRIEVVGGVDAREAADGAETWVAPRTVKRRRWLLGQRNGGGGLLGQRNSNGGLLGRQNSGGGLLGR